MDDNWLENILICAALYGIPQLIAPETSLRMFVLEIIIETQ